MYLSRKYSSTVARLDRLARVEDPDPALIPLQNEALDRVKKARDHGSDQDVIDAIRVARELGALG